LPRGTTWPSWKWNRAGRGSGWCASTPPPPARWLSAPQGQFEWDTHNVPEGEYFVLAVVDVQKKSEPRQRLSNRYKQGSRLDVDRMRPPRPLQLDTHPPLKGRCPEGNALRTEGRSHHCVLALL